MAVRAVGLAAGVLLLLAHVPSADAWVAGWDRPHHADLAVQAAVRLPEEERAFLLDHAAAFRKGALDPDGVTDPDRSVPEYFHGYEPASGDGGALFMAARSLADAVEALRAGDPEAAYLMGRMTHFVADLGQPMHAGSDVGEGFQRVDLLYHPLHEPYEHLAYDERLSYEPAPAHAPRVVHDVHAYLKSEAGASAAITPALLAALEAAEGEWTPEVRTLAEASATLTVAALADMLHTAFYLANATDAERAALDPDAHRPGWPDQAEESFAERPVSFPVAVVLVGALVAARVRAKLQVAARVRAAHERASRLRP